MWIKKKKEKMKTKLSSKESGYSLILSEATPEGLMLCICVNTKRREGGGTRHVAQDERIAGPT